MASHQPTQPEPDDRWPACDEQPPGVSIRPLRHGDLPALLAHLHHHEHDRGRGPAGRAGRAAAGRGRAGGGGAGAGQRRPPRRLRPRRIPAPAGRRTRRLDPWPALAGWRGAGRRRGRRAAGRPASRLDLAGLLAVAVAAGLGWRLRFRPSADTRAWRRGAAGERRTARLLAPLERRGWAVLHDLAIPGSPANIDHLVIGPGGVLVIDSKQYRGRLRLDRYGMLWHGRHLLVSALRKVLWEADQADEVLGVADVQVAADRRRPRRQRPLGLAAGRRRHHRPGPPAARPAAGAAADAWARAGGLAGRPSPAAVPRRRLTARTNRRSKRDCSRGFDWAVAAALDAFGQRRPGALLSSDDYGSSVERDGGRRPL